ncbi:MAG: 2-oxoglutarate oxidoreductase [Phycisphaerae bacterium SM23_30]|nr:MAG: 2-oxoglutarate oxidoreductase [Phycisphaerae bacterium SM23_30]
MKTVFERTETLYDRPTHYCPGCGHGVIHRLIAESIDELGLQGRTIGIAPVGCSVLAYNYINIDMIEVAHGRAPAVATGLKRCSPDMIVFSYQGDGDLASIGAGEILHATHRGERFTVFFVNNAIYGMTGGQMAPTTMLAQTTTTTPTGRRSNREGYPLQVCELLATLPGAAYIERCSVHDAAHIRKTKRCIRHALQLQLDGVEGLGLVEVLSPCPTYWRMSPSDARKWLEEEMIKVFPLGRFKG